jgi:hypothetical protein
MQENVMLWAAPEGGWPETCVEWAGAKGPGGYGHTYYEGRTVGAHRVAYAIANATTVAALKGLVVRHSCDNRGCINPKHLQIGTYAENSQDAMARGRLCHGERHRNAKLTEATVSEIKEELRHPQRGLDQQLAEKYGVSRAAIVQIKKGRAWSRVK